MNFSQFKLLFLILLFLSVFAEAEQRGGTLTNFQELKEAIRELKHTRSNKTQNATAPAEKCGLWIAMEAERLQPQLNADEVRELNALLAAPDYQKSRVIGRFEIHYDTTGVSAPTMLQHIGDDVYPIANSYEEYVDSAGKFFNDVWDYEIGTLGYPAPQLDGTNFYHVYITELGLGYYGYTMFGNQISSFPIARYETYIVIDNDFQFVYSSSRGVPGIKVTAAHEFHHAIQIGGYGNRSSDRYFYEITSTWMEDEVYNDVNDYLQYLSNSPVRKSQFSTPEVAFTMTNGEIEYSRCIWGKYLEQKHSKEIIKRIWEYLPSNPSLQAMNLALLEESTTFRSAFIEFSLWNSQTGLGSETDTIRYYKEGKRYPIMRTRASIEYMNAYRSLDDTLQAVSSAYYTVCSRRAPSDACGTGVQMQVIITNINMSYTNASFPFRYILNSSGDAGYKQLSNGLYVKLEASDLANWTSYETAKPVLDEVFVYPSVFNPDEQKQLTFVLPSGVDDKAMMYVFSSSMNRILAKEFSIGYKRPLEPSITWDGVDEHGDVVASGVYLVVVEVDGTMYKGKFAVIK